MKLHRTSIMVGVAASGLVAVLGTGVALAATAETPTHASVVTAETPTHASVATSSPAGPGGAYHGGHGMAMGYAQSSMMTAAARYLGLSPEELFARLHNGDSFADIAEAQGKSVDGLKNAILAAVKVDLATDSALTSDQRAAVLSRLTDRLDWMLSIDMGPGMMGNYGGGDAGGPLGGWHGGMMG